MGKHNWKGPVVRRTLNEHRFSSDGYLRDRGGYGNRERFGNGGGYDRRDRQERVSERKVDPAVARRDRLINAAEAVLTYQSAETGKKQEVFLALVSAWETMPKPSSKEDRDERLGALAFLRNSVLRSGESHDFEVLRAAAFGFRYAFPGGERPQEFASTQCRAVGAFASLLRIAGIDDVLKKHKVIPEDAWDGYKPSCSKGTAARIVEALERAGEFKTLNRFLEKLPESWLPRQAAKPSTSPAKDKVDSAVATALEKAGLATEQPPKKPEAQKAKGKKGKKGKKPAVSASTDGADETALAASGANGAS